MHTDLISQYKQALADEGFPIIFEWVDQPGAVYTSHYHKGKVSFFVVSGSVTFSGGIDATVLSGERMDVSPGVEHSAIVGDEGCHYIVGQEIEGDS